MGLESPTNQQLLDNSIGFFIPSALFFTGRIINGAFLLKRLQVDDYLMGLFFLVYIALLILINVSARYATNLYPPSQAAAIFANPSDVQNRIFGSILVIPLEQCMLLSTWGVKTCLLIFLYRMTNQMPRTRMALWILAGYIALGYVIIQICYYAILCRPFSQYWAMPVINPECTTYSQYSKIQMAFNISSDVFIILLPTTILWRSGLPMKRKLVLMGLFSLGLFTIICAIMNKYYNFASPDTTVYQLWYIREASVAMWVGNIICCWQLAQYLFKLRSFDDKHSGFQDQLRSHDRIQDVEGKSTGGHTKNTAWYNRMFEKLKVESSSSTEYTMDHSTVGEENVNDYPLLDRKQAIPASRQLDNRTVFSMVRDDEHSDARDAIAFRKANDID